MNDLDVLEDPALSELFDRLRNLGAGQPPQIGEELAAFFAGAVPLAPVRRRNRPALVAFAAAAAIGATIGSAAANTLPGPAQRAVADIVGALTPFELPKPTNHDAKPAHPPNPGQPNAPLVPLVPTSPPAASSSSPTPGEDSDENHPEHRTGQDDDHDDVPEDLRSGSHDETSGPDSPDSPSNGNSEVEPGESEDTGDPASSQASQFPAPAPDPADLTDTDGAGGSNE